MVMEDTTLSAASAANGAPRPTTTLAIAMIGTRGVPAAYGGFETAVEEVGRRLVARGHHVTVYTRGSEHRDDEFLGMRLVHLPALSSKQLETLSHTGLSVLHAVTSARPDVAFVFNAANSLFLPLLRMRGIPVALHMDGLEWRRSKWGPRGRAYYRWAEGRGVRTADALIADAPGIADYYAHQFGVPTELIRYGAPIIDEVPDTRIRPLGLEPGGFHLVVARFEPENHVLEIVEGYRQSGSARPLVVVGSAPYSAEYTKAVHAAAQGDDRIRFLGGVYDQDLLDQLYAHAYTYAHGHSVGGTNPSLLRAMGAGTAVIAYDVPFNREVLNERAWLFADAADVARHYDSVESEPDVVRSLGDEGRVRAGEMFRWDDVAAAYEDLAVRLSEGESVHRTAHCSRRSSGEWNPPPTG
jgi:glycosyltransferase involved in cell wall biosynthesis